MKLKAAGKFVRITRKHLGLEAIQTHVFVKRCNKGLLVTIRFKNQISRHEQGSQEVSCPFVVSNKVKARVCRVWGVSHAMATIILEKDVEIVGWQGRVTKVFEGILVPYDINVLKQEVKTEHGNELHAYDFGHHHGREFGITVALGGFCRKISEVL